VHHRHYHLLFLPVAEEGLRMNNKGALWLWSVAILTIIVMALAWFVLTWPTFMIIDFVESQYTFQGSSAYAATFVKNVLSWFLVLMSLGLLLWLYVNSQRKSEDLRI